MHNESIKYFMWGYQRHAQSSLEFYSKELFDKINPKLNPQVFFIGLLLEENNEKNPVCIDSEECGFDVTDFKDVFTLAAELNKADECHNICYGDEESNKQLKIDIFMNSYKNAILKTIEKNSIMYERKYNVSSPTLVNGYLVFTVLSFNNIEFENIYTLKKDSYKSQFYLERSFFNCLLNLFLGECKKSLKSTNKAIRLIERKTDELLREAGEKFMSTLSTIGDNVVDTINLYDACNEIASMKYEGAIGLGNIIIAKKGHKNIKMSLQLKNPIHMKDFRKVRKFLELSDNNTSIVSDAAFIYGLGSIKGRYNSTEEDLFVIKFTSHYKWEVYHDENPMMVVEYRQPMMHKDRVDYNYFCSIVKRIFKDISDFQISDLWDLTMTAITQKHGTTLVITDNAEEEAIRLGNQSFAISPTKITDNLLHQLTTIDGAVLLNPNSECFAIGVILDGLASTNGSSSRGARYNSSIRYYDSYSEKNKILIIIVSEDGMIDILPNLKPQINHAKITENIDRLTLTLYNTDFDRKLFHKAIYFLIENEFYLSEDECSAINSTRIKIEEKFKKELSDLKVCFKTLHPNKEMDDSYYK